MFNDVLKWWTGQKEPFLQIPWSDFGLLPLLIFFFFLKGLTHDLILFVRFLSKLPKIKKRIFKKVVFWNELQYWRTTLTQLSA